MGDEVRDIVQEESMPRPNMAGKADIAEFLSFVEMVSLRELNRANDNCRQWKNDQTLGQQRYCTNKVSAIRWLISINKQRRATDENAESRSSGV